MVGAVVYYLCVPCRNLLGLILTVRIHHHQLADAYNTESI